jgi:hypothetical protein
MPLAVCQFHITDEAGNIVPNADVIVTKDETGFPAATIYSDREGLNPISNQLQADAHGFIRFYAPGGAYRIVASKGGFNRIWRHVAIGLYSEADPDDFGQLVPTLRWRQLADITGQNLNNILVAGFYIGNNLSNAPDNNSGTFIVQTLMNHQDQGAVVQIAWPLAAPAKMFIRTCVNQSWSGWSTFANPNLSNPWTEQQVFAPVQLQAGSNIVWDVSKAQVAFLTLTQNSSLASPLNWRFGGVYILIVRQDAIGNRTLSFSNTSYGFLHGEINLNFSANQHTVFTFICSINGVFLGIGSSPFRTVS